MIRQIISQLADYHEEENIPYKHSFSYGIIEVSQSNNLIANDVLRLVDTKMYQNKFLKKSKIKNGLTQ